MNENTHGQTDIELTIAENLTQIALLLEITEELVNSKIGDGGDSYLTTCKSALQELHAKVNSEFAVVLSKRASILSKVEQRDYSPISKSAQWHSFDQRQSAILLRQCFLNISSLLNHACKIEQDSGSNPAESRLFRLRVGEMLGGPVREMLYDIFCAHPDLAVMGSENDNWQRFKENRGPQFAD